MHYSNLFQYFLSMCYGPYSSWKIQIFLCTCLLTFFANNYYDWWTHAYCIWNGAVHPSYINYCLKSEVFITLCCQLWSTRYTAFWIKNCSKSNSAIHEYRKKEMMLHTPATDYHLKSKVSIMLHCQLCSTRYTAVQIKNCSKSTSAIK